MTSFKTLCVKNLFTDENLESHNFFWHRVSERVAEFVPPSRDYFESSFPPKKQIFGSLLVTETEKDNILRATFVFFSFFGFEVWKKFLISNSALELC